MININCHHKEWVCKALGQSPSSHCSEFYWIPGILSQKQLLKFLWTPWNNWGYAMCNWLLVEMTSWLECVKMNNTLRSTSYFYIIVSTDIYTMIVLVAGPVDLLFWRDYYIIILQCSFQMQCTVTSPINSLL